MTVTWLAQDDVSGVSLRRQFPLALVFPVTVYKSQGMTLERACIDFGESELRPAYRSLQYQELKGSVVLRFDRFSPRAG